MYRTIMDNKILLSLCIPTYNRSETLVHMLDRVIHDPAYGLGSGERYFR